MKGRCTISFIGPVRDGLLAIPITVPELLRLLRDTVIPPPRRDQAHWSAWRHQHRARPAQQRWNAYAETTPLSVLV